MSFKPGFPDFHHKMSKKIAQLTKVIYHLNTKNDDNENRLQSMSDVYEKEIEEILQDASTKIKKYQKMFEKEQQESRINAIIKELSQKYQREQKRAQKEIVEYKKETKNRIQRMATNLKTVQSEVSDKVKYYENKMNMAFKDKEGLQAAHEKEIANVVRASNEKYNSLVVKNSEKVDRLRAKNADRVEKLEREYIEKIRVLELDLDVFKGKFEKKSMELDRVNSNVVEALRAKNIRFSNEIDALRLEKRKLEKSVDAKKTTIEEVNSKLENITAQFESLKKVLDNSSQTSKEEFQNKPQYIPS